MRRQAGNEREQDAGDHQQDGRRDIEPPRQDGDGDQHRQQQQQSLNGRRHFGPARSRWLRY